jgi:6-phosphogluconate dehydrogenase
MTAQANIGVVGLAVMGSNLARNLASREGNTVAIFNRSVEKTRDLATTTLRAGFVVTESIAEFAASLTTPRTAIIMVQAGAATDAVISQLADVFEPGDIIVDGGNAHYPDTIRREAELAARGLELRRRRNFRRRRGCPQRPVDYARWVGGGVENARAHPRINCCCCRRESPV